MSSSPFLPLPPGLEIRTTTTVDDLLRVEVASTRSSSSSPLCLHPAMRIHSRYRRVMALPTAPPGPVSTLGIDDWSFRRGRTFGTILVDLVAHQVIELLADRKTETAAAWMHSHDEIEIVSRDRGEDYAAAARLGAPQARQVADRFHLSKNLVEVVELVLARCRAEIRRASQPEQAQATPLPASEPPVPSALDWRPVHPHSQEQARLAHHAERYDRYQQLLALRTQGLTSKDIARRLGMNDRTVRHWLQQGIPSQARRRRKRSSVFDPLRCLCAQAMAGWAPQWAAPL